MEESALESERATVTHGATENAAQHIIAVGVAGLNAISDGKRKRADVVGDDAECHVDFFLFVGAR